MANLIWKALQYCTHADAQVAANNKGISLVEELINEYGLDVVQAYMNHIQKNAEEEVRDMLKEFSKFQV